MSSSVAFAGDLNFLNMGELLQLLGTSGATGVLRITSKYSSDPGVVYMEKGNPIRNATRKAHFMGDADHRHALLCQ